MGIPYGAILNLIAIFLFVFAFLSGETKSRIIFTSILILLFILPLILPVPAIGWAVYAGKVVYIISCYLYIKSRGYL